MIKIEGKIFHNLNYGHISIKKQLKFFPKEIKNIFPGTINLRLKKPIFISKYDYKTKKVKWDKKHSREFFLFKKCEIFVKKTKYDAWIYKASRSQNNLHSNEIEVISEKLSLDKNKKIIVAFENAKNIGALEIR